MYHKYDVIHKKTFIWIMKNLHAYDDLYVLASKAYVISIKRSSIVIFQYICRINP
jgi:hypothetical protein